MWCVLFANEPNQQLGDCIGKGAFGVVYQALNMQTGEVAAIKQISLGNIPKNELESMMVRRGWHFGVAFSLPFLFFLGKRLKLTSCASSSTTTL